jgi:glycine cleavage system protein P-like pyridoxal-binding family
VELIFELSEKGRKGYRLPKLDVPAVDVAQYLGEYYREGLNFPEVSELDVVRHYTKLSQRKLRHRHHHGTPWLLHYEIQPQDQRRNWPG